MAHPCLHISDTDTSVANTLRRIMISEVPTLAIDMVEFKDNTTCLQDEYIAHRLGMIPLRWEKDNGKYGDVSEEFNNSNFCQACTDGCPKCLVEFELSVNFDERAKQGGDDANFKTSTLIVTSEDLLSSNDMVSAGSFISDDEQENLHDGGITIVKMGPGQVSERRSEWSAAARFRLRVRRGWPTTAFRAAREPLKTRYERLKTRDERLIARYLRSKRRPLCSCVWVCVLTSPSHLRRSSSS